jgi:adenylylsulfate kinase-like enzyme
MVVHDGMILTVDGQRVPLSGLGSPYEPPETPDVVIDASNEEVRVLVDKLLKQIQL